MGRVMGFEPTYIGTTTRGLNHLATPATTCSNITIGKTLVILKPLIFLEGLFGLVLQIIAK
jgi:hypothetical protein